MEQLKKGQERKDISELLNLLIPPNPQCKIPGAGDTGVVDHVLQALDADPAWHGKCQDILEEFNRADSATDRDDAKIDRIEAVHSFEGKQTESFQTLIRHVYMAYYTLPEIPPLFGLSRKPPHPYGYEVEEESEDVVENLIAPVRNRGNCFQEC